MYYSLCSTIFRQFLFLLVRSGKLKFYVRDKSIFKTNTVKSDNRLNDDIKLLDIGCGPSIANIISASKYCSHITMADYLTSNRNEVERFKNENDDGFEWQHYFQFVCDLEFNPNVEDIIQRTRNSIKVCVILAKKQDWKWIHRDNRNCIYNRFKTFYWVKMDML